MAMMAAKGRLPDKAPQLTLDGANNRHTRMSAAVEATTVTKLLARGKRKMYRDSGKTFAVLTVWFTYYSSTSPVRITGEPWPNGTCQRRP